MARPAAPGSVTGADIARAEPWHRGASGNNLRAAVLGANDGLVSNFCLIMGVAGAGAPNHMVLLTGLSGLVAGACSMAFRDQCARACAVADRPGSPRTGTDPHGRRARARADLSGQGYG